MDIKVLKKISESFHSEKSITEVFEPTEPFKFIESQQSEMIVDGISILGKVQGQFFVPNGESRNGRYYTKDFWESVLSRTDIQNKIKNGLMGGQIGHRDTPVSDEDWNNGSVSHKITRLWIDENGVGMGEAVIFNTEAGRNLNAYLRSGTQLYTSSRASGEYKEGVTVKGLPVVDENTYFLDTFDFVKDPGFLQAKPKLIENFNNGSENMNLEEQVKQLQESVNKLTSQLTENKTSVSIEEVKKIQEDLNSVKQETGFISNWDKPVLEAIKKMTSDEISEMMNKTIKIASDLRQVSYTHEGFAYEGVFIPTKQPSNDLGKVHEAFTKENWDNYPVQVLNINKNENAYFGSNGIAVLWKNRPSKALESIKESIDNNAGLVFEGTNVNLNKTFETLRQYKELGTPEKIKEALTKSNEYLPLFKKYTELGTVESLEKLMKTTESLLDNIQPLGKNIGVIKLALEKSVKIKESYNKMIKDSNKLKLEEKAKTYSSRFDLPIDSVKQALSQMGESKAIPFFKSITKVENQKPKVNNEDKTKSKFNKSNDLIGRISESYHFVGGKN